MRWQPDWTSSPPSAPPKASPWSRLHPRAPANEPALGNWFSCAPRYHHLSTEMKTGLVPWGLCSVRPLKVISFSSDCRSRLITHKLPGEIGHKVSYFSRRSSCQRFLTAQQSMPGFVLIEGLFFSKVSVIIGSPSSNNKSVQRANYISLRL